jgi:hypothetical protein
MGAVSRERVLISDSVEGFISRLYRLSQENCNYLENPAVVGRKDPVTNAGGVWN